MTETLPQGFQIRSATLDDVKAVTDLLVACQIAEYGESDTTEQEVRSRWLAPGFDLALDSWVVVAPNGQIAGSASLGHSRAARMYTSPRVHPQFNSLDMGKILLRLVEQRARQLISEAPPDARVTLNTWSADVNTTLNELVELEGFMLVRSTWRMEIEMLQPPSTPEWPEGIHVRTFASGQEKAVFEAVDEAFRDHWGHIPGNYEMWRHWTVEQEDFDPSLWFLAWAEDEIAGSSLCENEVNIGWVDDLSVRRPWRRKGLGLSLLLHSFCEFYRRGMYKVGLDVDSQNLTGATRLYERVGMHKTRQYNNYEKELRAGVEISTQVFAV